MTTTDAFTAEDFSEAERYENLGPEYFAARRFMDKFMSGWTEEHLKPLADAITKEVTDKIKEKVWDDFRDYLLSDTEYNAQNAIRGMVNSTVEALLSGQEWALKRYPLTGGYDPHHIREAVAKHIPDGIAKARIADLEAEVKILTERLAFARGNY